MSNWLSTTNLDGFLDHRSSRPTGIGEYYQSVVQVSISGCCGIYGDKVKVVVTLARLEDRLLCVRQCGEFPAQLGGCK